MSELRPVQGMQTSSEVSNSSVVTMNNASYHIDRLDLKPRPVSPGRPRREVDVELLRMLRGKGYGYKRIAGEYTRVTSEYISHTTVRKRLVDG